MPTTPVVLSDSDGAPLEAGFEITNSASFPVPVSSGFGSYYVTAGTVTLSTTAAVVVPIDRLRRSVTIKNQDAAISIYIGGYPSPTLSSTTGLTLKAGESISIDTTDTVWAVAASGAPIVGWLATSG